MKDRERVPIFSPYWRGDRVRMTHAWQSHAVQSACADLVGRCPRVDWAPLFYAWADLCRKCPPPQQRVWTIEDLVDCVLCIDDQGRYALRDDAEQRVKKWSKSTKRL